MKGQIAMTDHTNEHPEDLGRPGNGVIAEGPPSETVPRGSGAGTRLWAAIGLSTAAVLTFVGGSFLVFNSLSLGGFFLLLLVAAGMSVSAVCLAHVGLKRSYRATLTRRLAVLVMVIAYLVLVPMVALFLLWVFAAGNDS
jgi:hypothetical protein